MATLLEASLQVHLLLALLRLLQTFLWGTPPIGLGVSVHDTHVVNTVSPIGPEVPDQKVSLLFLFPWKGGPQCCDVTGSGGLSFLPRHGATLVDEAVVAHVSGGEFPARQIRHPVTELIVTRRDEAGPLAIEGVADRELCAGTRDPLMHRWVARTIVMATLLVTYPHVCE